MAFHYNQNKHILLKKEQKRLPYVVGLMNFIILMKYYFAKKCNYCCPQHKSTKGLDRKDGILHDSIYMEKIMEMFNILNICIYLHKTISQLIKMYAKINCIYYT